MAKQTKNVTKKSKAKVVNLKATVRKAKPVAQAKARPSRKK
jgi:hypothetical protein